MITPSVQRWRDRRGVYRPAGEVLDVRSYEVAAIADDTTARVFVEGHHYSATYVAARARYGLYDRRGALVGVAVYSQPVHPGALRCLPDPAAGLELGRLVLLDTVPANGESWMVARCHALLARDGYHGAVAFSDDVRRVDRDGRVVLPGHAGTVYQALNAVYLGRGRPASLWLLPDGRIIAPRALVKVRKGETGRHRPIARLLDAGAPAMSPGESPAAWLRRVLPAVARPYRHPGCHKYCFGFTSSVRRHLPEQQQEYPKIDDTMTTIRWEVRRAA